MGIRFADKLLEGQARIGISLLNCLIALLGMSVSENHAAVRLLACISFIIFGILLVSRLNNIYFLARTLFLGGIGYYPMLIKGLAGPDALFSLYEQSTQSLDIVIVMYVATSFALFANELGLFFGGHTSVGKNQSVISNKSELWRTIFYASIPIVVLVSYVTAKTAPTIFDATYASQSTGQLLGNTQNIGIICILAMFVALYKVKIRYGRAILIVLAILFVVWAMLLRGMRQDIVTPVFGLLVCYGLISAKGYRLSLKNVVVLFGFVVFIEFMGVVRAMVADGIPFHEMWKIFTETLFLKQDAYQFGTVSPIATTFANSVYLIDSNSMHLLFGKSFLEFIPRTPPEFMYPGRPVDYAWVFEMYGLSAGGGIFELAEAYLNFGLIGALIVPFIISYLMARAFYNAMCKQTALSYFLLFSFLGMFLRGTWYQIFAFYKSFLTAIILFMFFCAIHNIFMGEGGKPLRRLKDL